MQRKFVIVQHSGYGYAGKEEFELGLESRSITTKAELTRVIRADGIVFNDYSAAERYCEEQMYPEGYLGMTPKAQGTFSESVIDGLRIYQPYEPVAVLGR